MAGLISKTLSICSQRVDSLSEQSRVVEGTAMPARREGSKSTHNKQNLDTKKLLLHGTNPRSCNDLVNSSFSPLLTSADFDMKEDYPDTALQPNSLPLHRGDVVCSTAVKPFCALGKSSSDWPLIPIHQALQLLALMFSTEAWIFEINKNHVSATRSVNHVKCLDPKNMLPSPYRGQDLGNAQFCHLLPKSSFQRRKTGV